MGSKYNAPPAPDYSWVEAQLKEQNAIAKAYLADYQEFRDKEYADTQRLNKQMMKRIIPSLDLQLKMAQQGYSRQQRYGWKFENLLARTTLEANEDWDDLVSNANRIADLFYDQADQLLGDYNEYYRPLDLALAHDAGNYASPMRENRLAGAAQGRAAALAAQQWGQVERDLASKGVNPSSGLYAAMRLGHAIDTTGQQVAAGDEARNLARDRQDMYRKYYLDRDRLGPIAQYFGLAQQSDLLPQQYRDAELGRLSNVSNLFRGYGAQTLGATAGLGQSGLGLGNLGRATFDSGVRGWAAGTPMVNSLATGPIALGNVYATDHANQIRSAGLEAQHTFSPASLISGMVGKMMGGAFGGGYSEGGQVPDRGRDPTNKGDTEIAKLSEGEYVIPTEIVRKKGTDFFDKLIQKGREELQEAGFGNDGGGFEKSTMPIPAAFSGASPLHQQPNMAIPAYSGVTPLNQLPGFAEGGEVTSANPFDFYKDADWSKTPKMGMMFNNLYTDWSGINDSLAKLDANWADLNDIPEDAMTIDDFQKLKPTGFVSPFSQEAMDQFTHHLQSVSGTGNAMNWAGTGYTPRRTPTDVEFGAMNQEQRDRWAWRQGRHFNDWLADEEAAYDAAEAEWVAKVEAWLDDIYGGASPGQTKLYNQRRSALEAKEDALLDRFDNWQKKYAHILGNLNADDPVAADPTLGEGALKQQALASFFNDYYDTNKGDFNYRWTSRMGGDVDSPGYNNPYKVDWYASQDRVNRHFRELYNKKYTPDQQEEIDEAVLKGELPQFVLDDLIDFTDWMAKRNATGLRGQPIKGPEGTFYKGSVNRPELYSTYKANDKRNRRDDDAWVPPWEAADMSRKDWRASK